MKNYILLFITLIPINLFSQEIMKGECIEGDCESGQGTFQFENGDEYIGQFQDGQRNGKGQYDYKSGARYDGMWKNNLKNGNGTYIYEAGRDKIKYVGNFERDNFNGEGTLYYKNGDTDEGLWKDDVFLGTRIGEYRKRDVLKKGDTIITLANNNKYLLSQQPIIEKGDEIYKFIPENSFIVQQDIFSKINPVGYITTNGETSLRNSTTLAYKSGDNSQYETNFRTGSGYANNFTGHKFFELTCDTVTYNKFIKFCDWRICKMTNTANVFNLSHQNYAKAIKQDTDLNIDIAFAKYIDISVNIASDALDLFFHKQVKSLGKNLQNSDIEKIFGINSTTSVYSYFFETFVCKGSNDICIAIVSCGLANSKIINPGDQLNTSMSDYIKNLYRSDDVKIREKSLETSLSLVLRGVRDCFDGLPVELKLKLLGKYYAFYVAGKNLIELGEILGLVTTNIAIKFSIAPNYINDVENNISNCRKKKVFLENYKKEYQSLIEKNRDNCLEYLKIINKLKSAITIPFGDKYSQEELTLMQKYVLGNDEIGKCNVLSTEQLRNESPGTQAQPQQAVDKNIIGYYGQIPVYKYDDSIVVDKKIYHLKLQPYQESKAKKMTRYFIIYEGRNVRFAKPRETPHENTKSFIGWVNYEDGKYTFEQYDDDNKVPGLNFFGSIYVGDNHLINPNGTPNYDIPWQDDVDKAAWEHDRCYDALGEKGKWGVVSLKTKNCDDELSVACFSVIINNYNRDMLDNPSKFVETLNLLGFSKETVSRICKKIISGNNLFFGESPLKERALLTGFAFAGITNVKAVAKVVDNVITDYGEREVKKHDLLRSGEQTVTYDAPTTLVSTSGEKYEAQAGYYFKGTFKDGKIEQGNLYDPNDPKKPVKTFFKKK